MHFNKLFTWLTALASMLLLLSWCPGESESSRILAVYPFPGKSHFMMHFALIKELVQRGHQVTMITAFSLKQLKLGQNYTEILIEPVYDFWSDVIPFFDADNIFELTSMGIMEFYKMLEIVGVATTEHALKQPKVMEVINEPYPRGKYDLLLCEQFYQEPFLALSYIYDIPVITTSTLGSEGHLNRMMGVIAPWSFVPHGFTPLTDRMTFVERIRNTYYSLQGDYFREFRYIPKMDKLLQKYFGHLKVNIPAISQMEKNISLMLLNSHTPLITSRPIVPGMIQVGGMHIYPPKKLPEDIQNFLDGANEGVIFFSLGSNVQSKDMPEEKLRVFLDVFATLKQRVIWKFESDSITDMPKNVLIKAWLPQSDILAHPKVKVFITHGGLFGTQEGVYHGIPMLGIPIYCDQHLNIKKAEMSGYAIGLQFPSITRENLKDALEKLLYDPSYRDNIKRISQIFRDRPMSARDTAMYWIEYVIRHKGAAHIRSAGLDLNWFQYYLLDVMALGMIAALLVVAVVIVVLLRLKAGGRVNLEKTKVN